MKKLLFVLFAALSSLACLAEEQFTFTYKGTMLTYEVTDVSAGTCQVTYAQDGRSKYSGNVIIPEYVSHNGRQYHVTKIRGYAFNECTNLTSITIPQSVAEIGGDAFKGCSALTSVVIPNAVTEIASNTFRDCTNLASITIPHSVTRIDSYAFENCGMKSIAIPNSVTYIGKRAFSGCKRLQSISVPRSVTGLGMNVFADCPSLTSITLSNP